MNLQFAFNLSQKVNTPFGEIGMVRMLGYDEAGLQYFIRTKTGEGSWFKESELTAAE